MKKPHEKIQLPASQLPWKTLKCQNYHYPHQLTKHIELEDGCKLMVRPICPADKSRLQDFVHRLSPESRYMRFMHSVSELTPSMLNQFTEVDYHKTMAFLALTDIDGEQQFVGVVRYVALDDPAMGEFALAITDQFQHRGLGTILMNIMRQHAKQNGIQWLQAMVLAENTHMLALMQRLHFNLHKDPDEGGVFIASQALDG